MSHKILIADDSPTLRNVAESLLRKHGYEVFSAKDGEEALRLAKNHRPDVAFLDDSMRVLNGEQVLKEFKQEKDLKDVPVVILLSRDETERRQRLKQNGTRSFIAKPLNPAQILERAAELLSEQKIQSSAQERIKPVGLPIDDPGRPDRVEQVEVTLPGGDERSDENLDIVTNKDLMQSTDPSLTGSDESGAHGFEWFLDELKKEANHGETVSPGTGSKSVSSEPALPAEAGEHEDGGRGHEIEEGEPGFDELISELKYDQAEGNDGERQQMERSVIENMSPSHLDRLVSDLTARIPLRVAQEVAETVTPELLERLIREELARVRKHSH
jgi:CheY-like chemotaxis protein